VKFITELIGCSSMKVMFSALAKAHSSTHLDAMTLASRTHGREVSPSGNHFERWVEPLLMNTHVLHTGASHKRPRPRMAMRSTSITAKLKPGQLFMSIKSPINLISNGTVTKPSDCNPAVTLQPPAKSSAASMPSLMKSAGLRTKRRMMSSRMAGIPRLAKPWKFGVLAGIVTWWSLVICFTGPGRKRPRLCLLGSTGLAHAAMLSKAQGLGGSGHELGS